MGSYKVYKEGKCVKKEELIDFCEMKSQLEPENEDIFNYIIEALEQDPCVDCISRDEAIRVAEQGQIQGYEWQFKKLCNLPSVTPQPKVGQWNRVVDKAGHCVWECDKCGWQQRFNTNYCPDCGAKKQEVQNANNN